MSKETEVIRNLAKVVAAIPVVAGANEVLQTWTNSVPAVYAQTDRCITEIAGRATNSAGGGVEVTFEVTAEGRTIPVTTDRNGIGQIRLEGPSDRKDSEGRDAKRVVIRFPLTGGTLENDILCNNRLPVNLSVPDPTRAPDRTPLTPSRTPSPDRRQNSPTRIENPTSTATKTKTPTAIKTPKPAPPETLKPPTETPRPTEVPPSPTRTSGGTEWWEQDPRNWWGIGAIFRAFGATFDELGRHIHDFNPIIGWVGDFAPARWYAVITSIGLLLRPTRVWTRNNLLYGPPRWIFHRIRDGILWAWNRINPPGGGPAAPAGGVLATAAPVTPAAPAPAAGGGAPAGPVP